MKDKPIIIKKGVAKKDVWYKARCSECGTEFKYTERMLEIFFTRVDEYFGVECPLDGCKNMYCPPSDPLLLDRAQ
jgi:hypothetical protein